jgi:hypothetical protein
MELSALLAGSAIEVGVAARPLEGEDRSGDLHVVARAGEGTLVAVIDGLGHGGGAADAAALAGEILEEHAAEPFERLLLRCHEGTMHSRGAVVGLARIADDGAMTWLAIGDIEGVLSPAGGAEGGIRSLPQHRGIVGRSLPPLRPERLDLAPGDAVIIATDGIRPDGLRRLLPPTSPQWLASDILTRSARPNDDALVVVVRYGGPA